MYFNKFSIQTDLSKSDIDKKLKTLIYTDKVPRFGFIKTEKYFYGKIEESKFSIARVVKGRNSFTPIINDHLLLHRRMRKSKECIQGGIQKR